MERAQCEHCGEAFYLSNNRRGRCQDAPDPVRKCIRRVSCMWLADTMLYHCMSDPEGDYSDPCSCDGGEGSGGGRLGTRWLALFGLSLVAPCLCLYPPLHACYRVGLACGCCGGRHKASLSSRTWTWLKPKPNARTGKGKDGETNRRDTWSWLLTLLPWFLWVSLQIPDTEISQKRKKTLGAFSERPGKISSPSWQTVLWALHMAICSVSSERALFQGAFFFYSWLLCHVSHMQVLYNVIFVHWLAVRELELFLCPVPRPPLWCTCGHFVYSNIRPAQLNSRNKRHQTLHLFACVRVCMCERGWYMCVPVHQGLLLSVLQLIVKLMCIVGITLHHQHALCSQ